MFSSPTVVLSVAMSMMLYMAAWVAPEPIFSKALAAAVTIGLLMTYTAAELYNVVTARRAPSGRGGDEPAGHRGNARRRQSELDGRVTVPGLAMAARAARSR